jgi:adenosylcobinamide kinase/adenosylcobinamide-phosphate guanylyltransferase
MSRSVLVLGGARSGKSRFAEGLAAKAPGKRIYIATAEAIDGEMRARIGRHVKQRGDHWQTIEAPIDLCAALSSHMAEDAFLLVECITVWINNLIHYDKDVESEVGRLCTLLKKARGDIVLVSNEVGLGIVPDNALARRFRDEAGKANQAIAAAVGEVYFVAAGLAMPLKIRSPA